MNLSINPLVNTLENATNSYKYYWLLGVIHQVAIEKQTDIVIEDIFLEMLVESWQTVRQFKLYYGFYDQLPLLIGTVRDELQIDDRIKQHDLRKLLFEKRNIESIQKVFKHLIKYVPYRFLYSWCPVKLTHLSDGKMHKAIAEYAKDSDNILYCFLDADHLQVKPAWNTYIIDNYPLIKGFVIGKLNFYLQKRNPNVPAILSKIQGIDKRNLAKAKKVWSQYMAAREFSCIYSEQNYTVANFSLDHFIPWSFVAHDELWNLVPTSKNINSQKSDQLPAETYIQTFIGAQFSFFHFIYENAAEQEKLLVDYVNIFKMDVVAIAGLNQAAFTKSLLDIIVPMFQIARNMGFMSGWSYAGSSASI